MTDFDKILIEKAEKCFLCYDWREISSLTKIADTEEAKQKLLEIMHDKEWLLRVSR